MHRNDAVLAPPPPLLNPFPQGFATNVSSQSQSQSTYHRLNPSYVVTVVILCATVIIFATIYLLLRCVSLYHGRHSSSVQNNGAIAGDSLRRHYNGSDRRVVPQDAFDLIDSLPLFTFSSLAGAAGDCAVCLSKFEPQDQLRLLPVCCHAFHADCIDAWIATSQTCPLCRSPIFVAESEVMSKILATAPPNSASRSGSFRVEIGSISRPHHPSDSGNHRRSYSIGSFDYIVNDVLSEVTISSTHSTSEFADAGDKSHSPDEADIYAAMASPGEILAAEVAGGGERGRSNSNWLRDYVDRIARTASFSLSSSFRSSGGFFVGSSRRTEAPRVNDADLEASRLGDEIGEMFRWLSGA